MEKTITIDDKKIRLKSTAATPLRFKAQFNKDYFSEILKLGGLEKIINSEKSDIEKLSSIDFEFIYNIIWVFAKTADSKIPEPIVWLDGFDTFPIGEILPQIMDLITSSIQGKKK